MNWFERRVMKARSLISKYQINNPKFVLDAGCGDGVQSQAFLSTFPDCQVIAIDVSLHHARKTHEHNKHFGKRIQVIVADYHNLPFCPNSFDLVLLAFSLHETTDKITVLKEALLVTKDNGSVIIVDYLPEAPTYWIPRQLKASPHEICNLISLATQEPVFIHFTFKNQRIHIIKIVKHTQEMP